MKKIGWILTACIGLFAFSAQADTASDRLLQKAVTILKNSKGTEILFRMNHSKRSVLKMQGNRFYINTDDAITWFDGKTMWYYAVANEEVNVNEPTTEELIETTPYFLMLNYQKYYNTRYVGKQGQLDKIVLTPKKKNGVNQITLLLDASAKVKQMQTKFDNTGEMLFDITGYRLNQKFSDKDFKFDKRKYPKAEIIDMR